MCTTTLVGRVRKQRAKSPSKGCQSEAAGQPLLAWLRTAASETYGKMCTSARPHQGERGEAELNVRHVFPAPRQPPTRTTYDRRKENPSVHQPSAKSTQLTRMIPTFVHSALF